jgi:hypothetical protein
MVFHGQMIFVEGKNCAPDEKNKNEDKKKKIVDLFKEVFCSE